jgi:hypothetical protein
MHLSSLRLFDFRFDTLHLQAPSAFFRMATRFVKRYVGSFRELRYCLCCFP